MAIFNLGTVNAPTLGDWLAGGSQSKYQGGMMAPAKQNQTG